MKNPMREQSLGFSIFVIVVLFVFFLLPYVSKEKSTISTNVLSFEEVPYTEESDTYVVSGAYPRASNTRASVLNEKIFAQIYSASSTFVSMLENNDWQYGEGTPKSYLSFEYTLSEGNGIVQTISFDFFQDISGAAHPYSYTRTLTFDVATYEVLTIEDLFGDNLEDLSIVVLKKVERDFSEEDQFLFFRNGFDPVPENYENFVVSDTGITFVFNPYQVAPYAYGTVTIEISYEDLYTVMNPIYIKK